MRVARYVAGAAVCVCALVVGTDADAQQVRPPVRPPVSSLHRLVRKPTRFTITIEGSYQMPSASTMTDTASSTINTEKSTYTSAFALNGAPTFDVSGGYRLAGWVSVVVGASMFSTTSDAAVTAQIPHPFFFNQPRTVSGSQSLSHEESSVRIDAAVTVPLTRKIEVTVSAGPVMLQANQDFVSAVKYGEAYPYDTANYAGSTTFQRSVSAYGIDIGAEVTYRLARNFGVGGSVRFSQVSAPGSPPSTAPGRSLDFPLGGTRGGVGIRFKF